MLACDGIWDCMTNEEVLRFVRIRLCEDMQPHQICEEIMDFCLATESPVVWAVTTCPWL